MPKNHDKVSRNETLPDSVWNDTDYLKQLEEEAEVDEAMSRYENNQESE